jgi:Tfp pilus assembly protein PilF
MAAATVRQGMNFGTVDQDYASVFEEAGLGTIRDAPSVVAKRVRESSVKGPLVAALDYWAICARKPAHRTWVLDVLRLADSDSWRDQARDPRSWSNVPTLAKLAQAAPVEEWTPQLLAVVGARLRGVSEGTALLRLAHQRYPDDFWVNFALGFAIEDESQEEALGYYRAALALRPKTPALLNSIGEVLNDLGRPDEALQEYRQAISLDSRFAYARYNFGVALKASGQLEEARTQYAQAAGLGYPPASAALRRCEKLISLRKRLPTLLAGKDKPADADELLSLAILCQNPCERRHAASASFYAAAFAARPSWAEDLDTSNRYNAACSAVRAGFGHGVDAAGLDEATRAKFRRQALEWLNADLLLWSKELTSPLHSKRAEAMGMLRYWRCDNDLLTARDQRYLATVPAPERDAWVRLWGEVEIRLKIQDGGKRGLLGLHNALLSSESVLSARVVPEARSPRRFTAATTGHSWLRSKVVGKQSEDWGTQAARN